MPGFALDISTEGAFSVSAAFSVVCEAFSGVEKEAFAGIGAEAEILFLLDFFALTLPEAITEYFINL